MRSAARVLLMAGVIAAGAAGCGAAEPAPATQVAAPPVNQALKTSCEALGKVYSTGLAPFAESLTKVAGGGAPARAKAQDALNTFAGAIREVAATSADAGFRTDGIKTADTLQTTASDAAFFRKVTKPEQVADILGPTLKQWLAPVTAHCS